ENPVHVPLLPDLLRLAAENRRPAGARPAEELERDVDVLHQALEEQFTGEAQRLRDPKLNGLAAFAAGAGHENNNPVAVISGQAQYMLGRLDSLGDLPLPNAVPEPDGGNRQGKIDNFRKALQAIVSQTKRIHQLLHDLMNFARPPRPQKQRLDV